MAYTIIQKGGFSKRDFQKARHSLLDTKLGEALLKSSLRVLFGLIAGEDIDAIRLIQYVVRTVCCDVSSPLPYYCRSYRLTGPRVFHH
jgi:hypothetical protein